MSRPAVDSPGLLDGLDRDASVDSLVTQGIARLQSDLALADPASTQAMLALLRRLYAAGRFDLALGRLFEGHIDALQIVARYAGEKTTHRIQQAARAGALFGVWNAPLPGEPLRLENGRLSGGKAFASGAGVLTHALVTANMDDAGGQMVLVDLAANPPEIDRSWWTTLGMQRSETHLVRWRGAPVASDALIGAPGDYARQPWFSAGALRFAAVQAGGVAALLDHTRDHLVARDRAADPHQAARLSELYALADSAALVCRDVAERAFGAPSATQIARVAHARNGVADAGERALALAQRSVGVAALFDTHPLARTIADLMVYLRQPAPDAQRMTVGRAVAEAELSPDL